MKVIDYIDIEDSEDLKNNKFDFYSAGENNNLSIQNPIFKTLLKLEFEKAIREYIK